MHTDSLQYHRAHRFVAQVSNLPYRRLPAGRAVASLPHSDGRQLRGLEIRDTADWKSALQATGAAISALVAQVSNLPYRRLPAGRAVASLPRSDVRQLRGLEIRDTADWKSALQATGAAIPALVAQVSNLPYRRLPAGRAVASLPHSDVRQLRRLEIRDTADWKSALQSCQTRLHHKSLI